MPCKARAQTATDDKQNNVWFTDKAGRRTRPIADGKDSDPDLSPDGHRVAYVRNGMGKPISTGAATPTELREVGADGKNPETLVRSAEAAEVEEVKETTRRDHFSCTTNRMIFGLAALGAPVFGADGALEAVIGLVLPSALMSASEARRLGALLCATATRAAEELGYEAM